MRARSPASREQLLMQKKVDEKKYRSMHPHAGYSCGTRV